MYHSSNKINLCPTQCNICGGEVIFTSNSIIYGKEYGSGRCYYCTLCNSYVGTHVPRPTEAFGILANEEMRNLKKKCHNIFDKKWQNETTSKKRHIARKNAYANLAQKLNIPVSECHFGYFDEKMLVKALLFLQQE